MFARDPPFCFYLELKRSQAEKYPDLRGNLLHNKTIQIQMFQFKVPTLEFPLQNLVRYRQKAEFSFQILPLVCK